MIIQVGSVCWQDASTITNALIKKKGELLFNESALPLGVYCIVSGVIKLVRTNLDGKEQILRFAQPGDVLAYRALIAEEPLISSAVCLEDTVACFIPKQVFLSIMDENTAISKDLLKALSHELGVVEERVQSLAQKSVRERLAETLLFLHATFKSNNLDSDVIAITLPREDIANIVGCAPSTGRIRQPHLTTGAWSLMNT